MEPILLTSFGERLLKYPGSQDTDESKLSPCIGIHEICSSWVDVRQISDTHNAICCRCCNLRIVIPNTIETFGQLRCWLKEEIEAETAVQSTD